MREEDLPESLRTELDVVKALLDAVKSALKAPVFGSFPEIFLREKVRAERYGRDFAVVVLVADPEDGREALRSLVDCLRASDLIGVVDGGNNSLPDRLQEDLREVEGTLRILGRHVAGAVLPETDRLGAQAVVTRLRRVIPEGGRFGVGMAVYPEDAVELGGLLTVAVEGVEVPETRGKPRRARDARRGD